MAEKVSVIIPAWNAGGQIHKLLALIKSQTIACEIVVIDSSSTDKTVAVSESYGAKVLSIRKEDFNHGRTRNIAASQSRGDIIVFMTQDALPYDEYCIEKLIQPIEQTDVAACYGRQIPDENAKPTEKFARYFNYPEVPVVRSAENIKYSGIKSFFSVMFFRL
jgi:rhamnosyltransferase